MNKVHTVVITEPYECSYICRIYKDKDEANSFAEKCNSYQGTYVAPPDNLENDEIFEKWCLMDDKWRANHPLDCYCSDNCSFIVKSELLY